MITEEQIARINELSRLSRQRALTEEEQTERQVLRAQYAAAFRESLERELSHTSIQYADGHVEKLKKKED